MAQEPSHPRPGVRAPQQPPPRPPPTPVSNSGATASVLPRRARLFGTRLVTGHRGPRALQLRRAGGKGDATRQGRGLGLPPGFARHDAAQHGGAAVHCVDRGRSRAECARPADESVVALKNAAARRFGGRRDPAVAPGWQHRGRRAEGKGHIRGDRRRSSVHGSSHKVPWRRPHALARGARRAAGCFTRLCTDASAVVAASAW